MRVFLYEFITAGGLVREPLPESLAREGELMARALARDLAAVPGVEVWMSRDPRLAPAPEAVRTLHPASGEEPMDAYARMLAECDAAWPVAPETGGVLETLSRITLTQGKTLLGSRPDAVAVTASKRAAAEALAAAGIASPPVFRGTELLPAIAGAWVVKPDDGAGCADTRRAPDSKTAATWLALRRGEALIAQPWIDGDALSISALFSRGKASLLSINRQHLAVRDGRVALAGLAVNALRDKDGLFERVANAVARAFPGLWGYAGIDLVDTAAGPVVIEVNPRLTTSYCALREALGINVAARVLELLDEGTLPDAPTPGEGRPIEIALQSEHAH
jgi:tyramine---L-glutamate ligase